MSMSRFASLFHAVLPARPLIAVVHLPPSLGYASCPGIEDGVRMLAEDLGVLSQAGFDGVLLENDADKPHALMVSKAQVAWLTRLAHEARARVAVPLGIGVQRIDWDATLSVAAAASLDFVRLDVFVDRVRMQGEIVIVDPTEVCALRQALGAERVQLWTDVHVKHADLMEERSIAESARLAIASGADAVIVTGTRTGEPPRVEDVSEVAAAARPVLIGSGLTPSFASTYASLSDGALVGSALKRGDRIDASLARDMVRAWRAG